MKITGLLMRGLVSVVIVMLVMPPVVMAQDSGETTPRAEEFTSGELAQMLAPIALYPDSVVAAILMAATYPVEVVEAERWLRQKEGLSDDELDQALQEKDWDSSVKTLCHFPTILYAMSENLERTTRLGDAFLAQQDDVMNMIQELRRKAWEEGNLKTTSQQDVAVEQGVVTIEPADPGVIYVPVYNPVYVYGPWMYPSYPPYYWYYPTGGIITSGVIGFGFGIFVGTGISSWCWPDWHHHRIDIDIHRTGRFNRFDRGRWDFKRHVWRHNPVHRRGAAYRFGTTGRRFGEQIPTMQRTRPEYRGYGETGHVEPYRGTIQRREAPRQSPQPPRGTIQKRQVPSTGIYRGVTPGQPTRGTIQRREVPSSGTYRRPSGESFRGNIFQGVGQGGFERRSSQRGFQSRQSSRPASPQRSINRGGSPGGTSGGKGGSRGGFRR